MKGLAITSLVLGIVALVLPFITCGIGYIPSLIIAVVGLILAALALSKYKTAETREGRGLAMAGLILCIVALGAAIITWIACAGTLGGIATELEGMGG
jgi:hypothetical protein